MFSTSCFESNCTEQAIFSCSCTKSLFMCQSHIGKHVLTSGTHMMASLVSLVPENQKLKVLNYLTLKRELARQNIKYITRFSNELIELIIDQTKKTQNILIIEQNNLNSMIKAFNKTKAANLKVFQ